MQNNTLSDYIALQELHDRIKNDPENSGWYMYKAYCLGQGASVDEVLEFAPKVEKKRSLYLVKEKK